MMRSAPLLAALLLVSPAHAQVSLGRLFATPAERAQMEATRGSSATLLPNSQGAAPAAGTQDGPPPPASASGTPGGMPIYTSASAGEVPNGPSVSPPGAPVGGTTAGTGATPAAASALTMTGVLRSSDNRTVVFLNGVPQSGPQNKLSRNGAGAPDVTVTLPSGRKITLKAGQRYDLNESRIKDVNEP